MPTGFGRPPAPVAPVPEPPLRLYPRLLGASWSELAESIRLAHSAKAALCGRLRISYGRRRPARGLAALLRLPRPSGHANTRLVITSCGDTERWLRTFDGRSIDTRQYRTGDGELGERIGVLEFRFRLEASNRSLVFQQLEAAFVVGSVRLRIPAAWAPRIEAREDPAGPRQIGVHVRVLLPVLGPLLTYDGTINVEEEHG